MWLLRGAVSRYRDRYRPGRRHTAASHPRGRPV